jgi:hypothetical protein
MCSIRSPHSREADADFDRQVAHADVAYVAITEAHCRASCCRPVALRLVSVDLAFRPRPGAGAFNIPIAFDVEQELEPPPDSRFGLLGLDAVEERFRFCSRHG